MAKIDHGAAGLIEADKDLETTLNTFYKNRNYVQVLPFDLTKAQKATKEILNTVPEQKQIIEESIENLKTQNIDPKFTNLNYEEQELGEFSKYLDLRKEKLQEFDKKLSLISTIEHPSAEWKKSGGWTEALYDPVNYAEKNGYKITLPGSVQQIQDDKTLSVLSKKTTSYVDLMV
ncbi:MAG TPA: hypothetical protein LFW21_02295 [Rickettsia endosymbiont of Pyrocoelia pectoralis]|nr:hypothetical protein [Rickettsia endosymbiont of Pyrocoelia pectoralis]